MRHEFTVDVAGKSAQEEIAILQQSAGSHPFVAWHGITAVNRFWFWDTLWPHGSVYLAGLPGHGPVRPHSVQELARWTPDHFIETGIATLRKLTNGQPATIIGHSTGGMIALGIAHKAPELVARLILISPVVWFELSGIVRFWQRFVPYPRLLDLIIGTSLGAGRRHHLVFLIALNAFIADRRGFYSNRKVFAAIGRGYEHMRQTQLSSIAGTTRVLTQADLRPMITQQPTTLPTLIIHGERDPIVPSTQSYWLANALPHAQLHIVPGVGHLAYGEQETIVNQSVADWLDRHPLEMRP